MNSLAEKTRLEPGWNAWQYLSIFIAGFILDVILHFLSRRKFYALKAGQYDVFGVAPSLMYYYNGLKNHWPLKNTESYWAETFNVWFWGGVYGGLACVFALLVADVILQVYDYVDENKIF